MLLTDDFEQRGRLGYYYRRGSSRMNSPYILGNCEGCGRPCLVKAGAGSGSRFCSHSCALTGERHPAWKGDGAGYRAAHYRVQQARGKASSCAWGCQASRYEWANLTGNLLDPEDYAAMCTRCHVRFDNAVRITATRPARWHWQPGRSNRKLKGLKR